MRLLIEIATAALIVICISASSAAFAAAGRTGRSADDLGCAVSPSQDAMPVARCIAIQRQCGGKFYASACGDRLMSAAN